MKELLYIPGGVYVRFKNMHGELVSYERIGERYDGFIEIDTMHTIVAGDLFNHKFYERNELPDPAYLTIEMFEIVEV